MKEKHPLDELVTKRIKLTPNEASNLVFYLETLSDFYDDLKSRYPKIAKDPAAFHSFIEVDFAALGGACIWADTMVQCCEKIKKKAHKGTNIIGDCDDENMYYSEEEGLVVIDSEGKKHTHTHWSPIEPML